MAPPALGFLEGGAESLDPAAVLLLAAGFLLRRLCSASRFRQLLLASSNSVST
jgi:hypothetical protein